MRAMSVPAGAKMMLGRPAQPMPREQSAALAQLAASVDGVLEAHLPQCFIVDVMEAPAQVLVVSIDPQADAPTVLNAIGERLSQIVPQGMLLDVWPLAPNDSMLKSIQGAGCCIFSKGGRRPWWKFW